MHNPDVCEGCHQLHSQCTCAEKAAYWNEYTRKRAYTMNEGTTVQAQSPFSRFKLARTVDVTGISGTGDIAYGVQYPDQSCALFWLKHGTHGYYKNISQLREIHCYNDNARVIWLD